MLIFAKFKKNFAKGIQSHLKFSKTVKIARRSTKEFISANIMTIEKKKNGAVMH